jgi:hypothetical protein
MPLMSVKWGALRAAMGAQFEQITREAEARLG